MFKKLLFIALLLISVGAMGQSDPAPSAPLPKPATAYQQGDSTYIYQNGKWFHLINMSYFKAHSAESGAFIANQTDTIQLNAGFYIDGNGLFGNALQAGNIGQINSNGFSHQNHAGESTSLNAVNGFQFFNAQNAIRYDMSFKNNHAELTPDTTFITADMPILFTRNGSNSPSSYFLQTDITPVNPFDVTNKSYVDGAISGSDYMPLSGGNFTGPVTQSFTPTITSGQKGFYIHPHYLAGANNITTTGIYIDVTNSAGIYTGMSGYNIITGVLPNLFNGDLIENTKLRINNIQMNYNAADSIPSRHYNILRDTDGTAIITMFAQNNHVRFGKNTTYSTYAFQVDSNARFLSGINAPSLPETTGTYGLALDGSNNMVRVPISYSKGYIDTLIAQLTPQRITYTSGSGSANTFTNTTLENQFIEGVWRDGVEYLLTSSGSPTGNTVNVNTTTGVVTFQDNITSAEYITVRYRGVQGSGMIGENLQLINSSSYASMLTQLSGTTYKVFFIQADEVNGGGLPTEYIWYNGNLIRNVPQSVSY